jgi:hypothetical protein
MELTTAEPNAFLSSLANSESQGEDSRKYNITDPSFYDRVRLYLKPTEVGEFWVFLILIFDWMLAALFVGC